MNAPDNPQPAKPKLKKAPRNRESYRAARRKAAREARRPMIRLAPEAEETIAPSAELNRSPNWSRAQIYEYAREISPSKEPVR